MESTGKYCVPVFNILEKRGIQVVIANPKWVKAVKDNKHPYYKLKYETIAKRRGKKRAIIAIARMILTAIYSMFSTGEVWNPVDLYKIDMPDHLKEQQLVKAIKQATHFLEKQGLTVA